MILQSPERGLYPEMGASTGLKDFGLVKVFRIAATDGTTG
jgi:hypothetical protein